MWLWKWGSPRCLHLGLAAGRKQGGHPGIPVCVFVSDHLEVPVPAPLCLSLSLSPCLSLPPCSELTRVPLSHLPPAHGVPLLNFIFPGLQLTEINPPFPPPALF